MPAKKTTLDAKKAQQVMVTQPALPNEPDTTHSTVPSDATHSTVPSDATHITVPFATRIPKPLIKRLNLYRIQNDTTVQEVVRLALEQYLNKKD